MSLAINTNDVAGVLLADGWHSVTERSFDLDAYEFQEGEFTIFHGDNNQLVCSTGFTFLEAAPAPLSGTRQVWGPLTAILALRSKAESEVKQPPTTIAEGEYA